MIKRYLYGLCFITFCLYPEGGIGQVDEMSYIEDSPGAEIPLTEAEEKALTQETDTPLTDESDPFEDVNRVIFDFNDFLDMILINPISWVYVTVLPESMRDSFDNVLRNLNEPIVLANNLLQGDIEGARVTLGRFLLNSTVGIGGVLDLSTEADLPYKKQDFGLTLASWGMAPGPYIVLPILGPSNLRDTCGKIGDYVCDPINWWAYFSDEAFFSYSRTGFQILAARAGNLNILRRLKEDAIDYYATTRTWYQERRNALIRREGEKIETPTPDDEDEDEDEENDNAFTPTMEKKND